MDSDPGSHIADPGPLGLAAFAGTTFVLSLFNAGMVGNVKYVAPTLPPVDAHTATGIFLLMWTVFTAFMAVASVKTNAVLAAVLVLLLVTFALLTLGAFNQSVGLNHAGGYVGLGVAALGWYGAAAAMVNSTWGRTVLPLFPARKA